MKPTLRRAGLIGAGLAGTGLAALGLVSLDENGGAAHLNAPHIAAAQTTAQNLAQTSPEFSPAPAPAAMPPAFAAGSVPSPPPASPLPPSAAPATSAASHGPAAASDQAFVIKRILPIDGPIKYGEWHWNEANVPPGPLVITVDLQARVLSAFRGGYEIGAAAVLVGGPEKPTPTGVFPITQKQVQHFSNLYGEAPMPYMQRLTNDGVTLHSTNVRNGYASHGCVGMPLEFARKLFGVTHLGDKVIITDGKRASLGDSLVKD